VGQEGARYGDGDGGVIWGWQTQHMLCFAARSCGSGSSSGLRAQSLLLRAGEDPVNHRARPGGAPDGLMALGIQVPFEAGGRGWRRGPLEYDSPKVTEGRYSVALVKYMYMYSFGLGINTLS